MSAYVVTPEHIRYLADTIVRQVEWNNETSAFSSWCGYCVDDLCAQMWSMNVAAVTARYGDRTGEYGAWTDQPGADKRTRATWFNVYQFLKSLHCYLYQCAEGGIPEKNPLYAKLQLLADHLARHVLDKLPPYQAAVWGVPTETTRVPGAETP